MAEYRKVFPNRHALLLAIHLKDPEQCVRNVRIAYECAADGVFLVNHEIISEEALRCYEAARKEFPHFWIGMNFLDLSQDSAIRLLPVTADGLWLDNLGLMENDESSVKTVRDRYRHWCARHPDSLLFGGIAFKGQAPVHDSAKLARAAVGVTDVITTSGPSTGRAPLLEKIIGIREAIGPHVPFANASGMSPDNVDPYLPYLDAIISASKISKDFYELDQSLVEALARKVH
jgi:hypothetical protein